MSSLDLDNPTEEQRLIVEMYERVCKENKAHRAVNKALHVIIDETTKERDEWKECHALELQMRMDTYADREALLDEVRSLRAELDTCRRWQDAHHVEVDVLRAERDEARALKVPPTVDELLAAKMDASVARVERDEARQRLMIYKINTSGSVAEVVEEIAAWLEALIEANSDDWSVTPEDIRAGAWRRKEDDRGE